MLRMTLLEMPPMRVPVIAAILLASVAGAGAAEPAAATDRRLTVLTNNVGIFPRHLVALYPEKLREKKQQVIADETEHAAQLAQALLAFAPQPDVVLLQEIWSVPARDRLIQDLAPAYPHYRHPPTLGMGPTALQASGLVVFSKHPLEDFAFQPFSRGLGPDKLARKGIVGVRLTRHARPIAVFTTHLQAGGKRDRSIKPDQLRECHEFIRKFAGDGPETVRVLAGDFNIRSTDRPEYDAIFAQLAGARDTYQAQPGHPTTTTRNAEQAEKRIDYLLTFGTVRGASTIVDLAGPRVTDHLAVFGTIDLD